MKTWVKGILAAAAAWLTGLVLDANIPFGDPQGFLCLRVLFPVLVMGGFILWAVEQNKR